MHKVFHAYFTGAADAMKSAGDLMVCGARSEEISLILPESLLPVIRIPEIVVVAGDGSVITKLIPVGENTRGGVAQGIFRWLTGANVDPDTANVMSNHVYFGRPAISVTTYGQKGEAEIADAIRRFGGHILDIVVRGKSFE